MQYALLALAAAGLASARPGGVTGSIAPSSAPPAGCELNYDGTFTLAKAVNAKRQIAPSSLSPDDIVLTLVNGQMKDPTGETAYIASNQQFQFDNPPQAGAIYTAGFSICPNMTIALGDSAVFYQCRSGSILNIYDTPAESACSPIFLEAIPIGSSGGVVSTPATTPAATSAPPAAITSISDAQPQAPSASAIITSITDHQPQAPSQPAYITSITDHQPQAPSQPAYITSISDHQPQAPTGTGYVPPAPPVPTVPANGANKALGAPIAALAAGALAVAML